MYSPNRFYLTLPHDNSWSFDKILNIMKKLTFSPLYKFMIFPPFWQVLISFFLSKFCETFLLDSQCTITIMIIIINDKSFIERHFLWDFWCTAQLDKFYAIYLVLAMEKAQVWHLWEELLKSTSKIWKPEVVNYIVMKDLNLWQILAEVLLELIN